MWVFFDVCATLLATSAKEGIIPSQMKGAEFYRPLWFQKGKEQF